MQRICRKELDLKYSQPLLPNQSKYYDSVAYTASHVNMMLTNALCFMMDKTECFIFLNTPNALKSFDKVDKTESPWIYTEISLSKTLKITPPLRPIEESVLFNADTSKPKLTIRYNLDLSHLTKLNISQLFTALPGKNYNTSQKALDAIYKII